MIFLSKSYSCFFYKIIVDEKTQRNYYVGKSILIFDRSLEPILGRCCKSVKLHWLCKLHTSNTFLCCFRTEISFTFYCPLMLKVSCRLWLSCYILVFTRLLNSRVVSTISCSTFFLVYSMECALIKVHLATWIIYFKCDLTGFRDIHSTC